MVAMYCNKTMILFVIFQKRHQELQNREEPMKALLEKGQEIIDVCRPEDVVQISDRLRKLKERWSDTKDRAQKRKVTLWFKITFYFFLFV